ncbi:MAG: hypothetical protein ACRECJ_04285, partial [Limisphaerales bacterium]
MKRSLSDSRQNWQRPLALFFVFPLLFGCGKPYMVEDFESTYKPRASVIAIAPLTNFSTEPEGAWVGEALREGIYYEMVRHRDDFTVEIQDIAETDQILKRHNLSEEEAARLPGADLCRLLGVDAVMKGSVFKYLSISALEQVAEKVVFDTVTIGSEIKASLSIYDAADGELVWQQDFEQKGMHLSSVDELRKNVAWSVA